MRKINCRGLRCPRPVDLVKKYFDSIGEGDATVYVDNEVANDNILRYGMSQGYHVESEEIDEGYELTIEKRGCLEVLEEEKEIVILVTSDKFGEGNEKLGRRLMTSYFDTLSEEDKLPKKIIFINGGIKLISEGSEVLEGIKLLVEKGVEIYASRVCVDEYDLRDKILFGKNIDMSEIIEFMNDSEQVIKI